MDALLNLDSPRGNYVCSSIQEIQDKLHHSLISKSSDTHAEHTSITFEFRHNTLFNINGDTDNNSPDGSIDPTSQSQQPPIARTVNVSETVQNQPADDPVLQRAVAKHIVGAMGVVDGSSWVVRKVSRGAQGWTFTYICKDSLQEWNHANGKNTDKFIIASYSGPGSLDPTTASRPAFDCRGTLNIAFSKSTRGIIVKYNHTPIHKTVQQLFDLLTPDLPPPPVNKGTAANQRTPKVKRPPPTEGEEGSRRKRPRKKDKAPEAPMGDAASGSGHVSRTGPESQNTDPSDVHYTSVLNVPPDEAARRQQTAIELLTAEGIDPGTLSRDQFEIFSNQSPELQAASLEMLKMYGAEKLRIVHPLDVDEPTPSTSTPAEGQSSNVTPAASSGPKSAPATNETPTKRRGGRKKKSDVAVAEAGAVVPVEQNGEVGTTASTLKLTVKPRKTRGACQTCKVRKTQCTKQHPSCSICLKAGVDCVYLPPKPRRRKSGKSGEVVDNEDSDMPREDEQDEASNEGPTELPTSTVPVPEQHLEQHPEQYSEQYSEQYPEQHPEQYSEQHSEHSGHSGHSERHPVHEVVSPPPDPDNEEFIPDPNILSASIEHQPTTEPPPTEPPPTHYYSGASSGFPFSQDPQPSSGHLTMPTLTFPESQTRGTQFKTSPNLTFSSTSHQNNHSPTPTHSQVANQERQNKPRSGRRSLPTSQNKQTPVPVPIIPHHTPTWNASPTPEQAVKSSPTMTKKQASRRSKQRHSNMETNQQTYDDNNMQPEPALSQPAIQKPNQPPSMRGSPYQTAAQVITQARSQQGQRSRTNTPVTSTSRPPPQAPQAAMSVAYSTAPSSSTPNFDSYGRYNNTTNAQYDNVNNDEGSSRIAYQPGSYHPRTTTTTSTSYPSTAAYDYSRSTGSTNPLSRALDASAYTSTSGPTTSQWATSQSRSSTPHTQSHTNTTYAMASTAASTSHNYGTRSTDRQTSHQSVPYSQTQTQTQSYGSYSTQQPNTNQQTQQNWYGITPNNSNSSANQHSYSSNRNSGYTATASSSQAAYNSHRSAPHNYSGHGYGSGADDQALYDLLRAGNSAH
ncbi:uncharacterized protein GGS22DRAFT_150690 [Annulohypoxylon maeteangense]|uniref:uncharacterized protein n=1 Tax=Annulohypoxylon maeteangense TaxID=1927788 RepID=UPI002008DF7F|nr:uncharacterized protein GGS22DRAFT_150690 [Annulohypoxylon maeteangense]KAI0890362.1 hypothetical protein GGS22DRAFT_150690 [Annulohypoxylon maeteangense]